MQWQPDIGVHHALYHLVLCPRPLYGTYTLYIDFGLGTPYLGITFLGIRRTPQDSASGKPGFGLAVKTGIVYLP